jgi:Phage integrase, N-terminal SAM-like domain
MSCTVKGESGMDPHPTQASRPPRLLDQVREAIRLQHYSIRTEQAYMGWITRYILFHGKRHASGP